jgi:hypothetical protein
LFISSVCTQFSCGQDRVTNVDGNTRKVAFSDKEQDLVQKLEGLEKRLTDIKVMTLKEQLVQTENPWTFK